MTAAVPPEPWPRRPVAADAMLVFGVFALLALGAIHVSRQPGSIATLWLANGAAVALIATAPRERFVLLLVMVALGNLAANLAYGDTLTTSLAFVPPNVAEVALGAWSLQRLRRSMLLTVDVSDFLRVALLGAALPPLLGATLGAAVLQLLGFARFERVWVDWYVGAAAGATAVLPLVLALRTGARLPHAAPVRAPFVLVGVAAVAALVLWRWDYPFVVLCVGLSLVAVMQPRLVCLACPPVVMGVLAVSLAWAWYAAPGVHDAPIYLSALLAVLPAQLLAVAISRQRALDELLAAVASREDDIILFIDMNGTYRWVNRAREQYLGVPSDRALGRHLSDNTLLLDADNARDVRESFEQALAGHTLHKVREVIYPGRGARTMDIRVQPARDDEGRQIGVLFCANDITDFELQRRELERTAEQLRASNESLQQFVRIASHDLREPLNTIEQFMALVQAEQAARMDDAGRLWFAQVREGAARMRRMLDDLLQYVRLDGEPALPPAEVALDELLHEVRQALGARIASSGAQLTIAAPLGRVRGQRAPLTMLLQNLVANALKFMPPDRTPHVRVSAERVAEGDGAGLLRLTVADNGIGIDPARVAELGQPFRRLHARRRYEGTGLGLAICMRVAQQHGGRIDIHSTPGEGSRFTLVLPQG